MISRQYNKNILDAQGDFIWTYSTGRLGNWTYTPPLEFGLVADIGSGPTSERIVCRAYFVPWDPETGP